MRHLKHALMTVAFLVASWFAAPAAFAQNTTQVSAQVIDPNGWDYSGATATIQLSTPGATVTVNNQAQCSSGGFGSAPCQVPINGQAGSATLDQFGKFAVTLYPNASIQPAGTQWVFTINYPGTAPPLGTGGQSFSLPVTIAGSTQDITGPLNAVAHIIINVIMGGGGSGCTPTGGDTAVQTNHPIGTCYGSQDFTWDDTLHNFKVGVTNSIGAGSNLTFAIGDGNSTTQIGTATASSVNIGSSNTLTSPSGAYGGNEILGTQNTLAANGTGGDVSIGAQNTAYHLSFSSVMGYSNAIGTLAGTGSLQFGTFVGSLNTIMGCKTGSVTCNITGENEIGTFGDGNSIDNSDQWMTHTAADFSQNAFIYGQASSIDNVRSANGYIYGFDDHLFNASGLVSSQDVSIFGSSIFVGNTATTTCPSTSPFAYFSDSVAFGSQNTINNACFFLAAGFNTTIENCSGCGTIGYNVDNSTTNSLAIGMSVLPELIITPGAADFTFLTASRCMRTNAMDQIASSATDCGSGGTGVASLNSLTGVLTIVAGANITVTPSGSNITIAATSSAGGTVTTTGSPASPNLGCFSGTTSITSCNLSGDATTSGSSVVLVSKINGATMPVTAALLGTNSSQQIIMQTAGNATAFLNLFTSSTQGLVPASGGSDPTKFLNETGAFTAPTGSGTVNTGTQFAFAYYATATNAVSSGPTPPTINGTYNCGYLVTASVAVSPSCSLIGLLARSSVVTTDLILYSDNSEPVEYQGSTAVAVTLRTAITLGNPNFFTVLDNLTTGSSTAVTVTPTTWTINGASTLVIPQNFGCRINVDPSSSTNWLGICGQITTTGSGSCPTCVTAPAALTNGHIVIGNGLQAAAADPIFDDGITTANALTYTGSAGIIARGGQVLSIIGALGTTTSTGLFAGNGTAATSGNQQNSPALTLEGQGWKTNTTAASEVVDFSQLLMPVQGTATPTGTVHFQFSLNSGGYADAMTLTSAGVLTPASYATASNCSSSASPAVCGSAAAGSVALPTNAVSSSIVVNTSAVTANSQILVATDDTLGTKLGVTCNSTVATLVGGLTISARTGGTSFTISNNVAIVTNPLCVSYVVMN